MLKNEEIENRKVTTKILNKIKNELNRQLDLQKAGRFEKACTDINQTDTSSFIICTEEYVEVVEALYGVDGELETEIIQTAATFVGWLIARRRKVPGFESLEKATAVIFSRIEKRLESNTYSEDNDYFSQCTKTYLQVVKTMQDKNQNSNKLDKNVEKTASEFIGWLIADQKIEEKR